MRKIVADLLRAPKDGAELGATELFSAAVAEAVVGSEFDPVDVVTEVTNPVEYALGEAMGQGLGPVAALGPMALAAGAGVRPEAVRPHATDRRFGRNLLPVDSSGFVLASSFLTLSFQDLPLRGFLRSEVCGGARALW